MKESSMKIFLLLISALLTASPAFAGGSGPVPASKHKEVCILHSMKAASGCKESDIAAYLPGIQGKADEFLLTFIAKHCDMTDPIQMNPSGVVCTFTNKNTYSGDERFQGKGSPKKGK
jgi:hypothetical protein